MNRNYDQTIGTPLQSAPADAIVDALVDALDVPAWSTYRALASRLVNAAIPLAVSMRDAGILSLDEPTLAVLLQVDRLELLAWCGESLWPHAQHLQDPLRQYLLLLPGYQRSRFFPHGQLPVTIEKHEYARSIVMAAVHQIARNACSTPSI